MNRLSSTVGILVVVTCCLLSCQTKKHMLNESARASFPTADDFLSSLALDSTVYASEAPFAERKFIPYLNDKWIGNGISYGCYRDGQAPGVKGPSEVEILEDLNLLSPHWNLIRVYGSDDDSERILKVIHENQLPIRMMLGIWLENETKNPDRKVENLKQVTRGIELANRFPDEVIAINVGNESQVDWSWHRMEMKNLIRYIRAVRNLTKQPVTTADDYNFWNKDHSKLVAAEIDFMALHAYPLWNGKTLENAMAWTDSIYTAAQTFHPGKEIILSETGWATLYNPEKKGPGEEGALVKTEVSLNAQERFVTQLSAWTHDNHVTTFLFEAFDEPWKGGGLQSDPNVMEKHWGVFFENRKPKWNF
ncbi:MAG: glycosyl hydrolase family 17 [Candidatus Marinimicrobia bacterium]|nr:glycosyl hydrolase family 17 [Candidatus Neomarinimicrobiota bacterium]